MSQGRDEPGVRLEKIAALRASIAAGTYAVSVEALADRLIDVLQRR